MIANSSSVTKVFDHVGEKFKKLWRKRMYVHKYLEYSMEEADFEENYEAFLEAKYATQKLA